MREKRFLIVNADDFGQSHGVNGGIIQAHEQGIVTSASLMVRWPAAAQAAAYGREHPELSLGLHVDLGEWAFRDGTWALLYEVVPESDICAVRKEIDLQIAAFRALVGKHPTHLDSHQHVHLREPVRSVAVEAARKLGVPLRGCTSGVDYCGRFYGQTAEGSPYPTGISVHSLLKILTELKPGLTELGCHPGQGSDLTSMYTSERAEEVKTLCDPRVRTAVADMEIEFCSFGSIVATSVGSIL